MNPTRTLLASSVLACALSPALDAQSSVRSWGSICFDTESRHGKFVDVDAEYLAAVFVRNDGRAFGQGVNVFSQPALSRPGSLDIGMPPPGLKYVKMRTSGQFTLGLLSDGTVVGFGTINVNAVPIAATPPPLPPGMRYVDLDTGGYHGLLLRSDGALVAFGDNLLGQTSVPPIPLGVTAVRVRCGPANSFALLSDGSILAWGSTQSGLNNVPTLSPGTRYIDLSVGGEGASPHAVALRSDGTAVAWGGNGYGQCNVPSPGQHRYLLVGAGYGHSMAWRSDGVFIGWGSSAYGALSVPSIPPGETCRALSCGFFCTLALMSDGQVLAWGENAYTQSFLPDLPRLPDDRPLAAHRAISAASNSTASVLSDGTIQYWGSDYGIPGLGTPPPGLKWAQVGCGIGFNVAMTTTGDLYAWGTSQGGRTAVPPLPQGVRYVGFAVGLGHTVALRSDGQAVHFGLNDWGEGNISPPPPGIRYVGVAAEHGKTLLLRSDGTITPLGNLSSGWANVPALPPGLRYVQVAAPEFWSAALRSDGSVATWGGAPADPFTSNGIWKAPPPLPFGVSYVQIHGHGSVLALRRSDGQVVAMGYHTRTAYPPDLEPGTSYIEVATGGLSSIAARVGPTSTYVTFAAGCAGSRQPARLIPMDTPRIGNTLVINLFDLPVDAAFLALGWARTGPISLATLGLPGCDLQITIDDVAIVTGQGGTATHSLRIPDLPVFLGMHFYHQALVPDPAAGNALDAVVSNAAEGVVGDW